MQKFEKKIKTDQTSVEQIKYQQILERFYLERIKKMKKWMKNIHI